jgi:sialic acid synthase
MRVPRVIAEIGCNHKGDIEIAKEMIRVASSFCGADIVKFQKRHPSELLSEDEYYAPHPNPQNSYGETYGAHREFLEFTKEQHKSLMEYCRELGVEYSTSVWDMTSAKEIVELSPSIIKVPSAMNNHFEMMSYLCENFEGELHVSTGMTSRTEIEELVNFFVDRGRNQDVVLFSCTSGYPVDFSEVCLLEISRLRELYGDVVKEIGFSGHHLGIAVDVAAFTLGATTIERHFTLDRTWKGTDHAASLEPDGLRRLVRDLRAVNLALTYKDNEILDIEWTQRDKLKYKGRLDMPRLISQSDVAVASEYTE